jgi:hypothetical protein
MLPEPALLSTLGFPRLRSQRYTVYARKQRMMVEPTTTVAISSPFRLFDLPSPLRCDKALISYLAQLSMLVS